ncbi:hypothetical protein EN871_21680 [bacterium M00.F.Ca.ET.228.01.1.1]|uniref:TIM barrel protein n=1 Tax=Paraburkholderia phenoliruptrix TaxID=252970 RepID=UPI001091DBDB|nr:TIM barrel protein [Paraburkholderia phenoliruptrix]TGP42150.1 hypothetical protein EN871_21680 [bacterium M00.F.Ca.ET.228.01.1.1]TGR99581.1 hypothetical protein EN834_19865 [bacterium M00.F.Ca.ET.191.01.1.1]TGU03948.1 hypothetical protein EN798_20685 [bacterium M00.F.Ca.ET.155.01.1.1]MBW0448293.1 TIM barrel protein [Paraburkholderia phenoliruptrix]MBW9099504.1 TIM barrel protein [Paraburkholderia phenoliruptrix]
MDHNNLTSKIRRSQIAGMNLHYVYFTFEYFLNSMEKFGIESIELWGGTPHFFAEHITYDDVRRMSAELTKRRMKLVCFTPEQVIYPFNIAASEKDLRARSIQYFRNNIIAAADLGAPLMLVTSGWGYFDENRDSAWQRAVDALQYLSSFAEQNGVMLTMEAFRPEESNLVNNLSSLKKMLDEVSSKFLTPCLDTIAMGVANESMQNYFDVLGQKITHCHFVDGNPYGHMAWGEGSFPLDEFVVTLNRNAYHGHLGLELTESRYLSNPDEPIKKTMETLLPYFS